MNGEDEQLLLDYARRGEVKSLSALVTRTSRPLMAYLRGMSPSDADAEDAFQECWMRVVRSCGSYRGGSVRAYLMRTARSVVIDRFRRRGAPTVSIDAEEADGLESRLAAESPTPDRACERAANAAAVREAVRALPERQREVLLLRIEGELPFKEIAAQMGISLGTALTWMHAATMKLKKMLGGAR